MSENKTVKNFNPFSNGLKHYDLDYTSGTLHVVQNGSEAVIYIETNDGEKIVLNTCEYHD